MQQGGSWRDGKNDICYQEKLDRSRSRKRKMYAVQGYLDTDRTRRRHMGDGEEEDVYDRRRRQQERRKRTAGCENPKVQSRVGEELRWPSARWWGRETGGYGIRGAVQRSRGKAWIECLRVRMNKPVDRGMRKPRNQTGLYMFGAGLRPYSGLNSLSNRPWRAVVFFTMNGNQVVCRRRFKFFRVFLPGYIRRLPLPRELIKYFIEDSGTWATLLSPLGKSWHVKVNGDNRTLSFEDGWEKFAEDHKLTMWDFLVFKHKGSLIFDVTIFDLTACERDYTSGLTNGATNDKISPRQEKIPGGEEINNNSGEDLKGSERQEASSCGKRAAEPMEPAISSKYWSSGIEEFKERRQDDKKPDVMKGDTRGPRFEVIMRFSYLRYVEIPAAFSASNNLSSICQLFLEDPNGKVWLTNVKHRHEGSRIRSRICEGWAKFCVANGLEVGDVCVFELKEKNVLHVLVQKGAGLQTHRREDLRSMKVPEVKCYERQPKLMKPSSHCQAAAVGTVQDQKPLTSLDKCTPCTCFMSKISPGDLGRGNLKIPRTFLLSLANFSAVRQIFLVDPQSRQWPVNICHWKVNSRENACFGAGWRSFCICNNIEAGDACIFKLMSKERGFVFHVEVIKPPSSAL